MRSIKKLIRRHVVLTTLFRFQIIINNYRGAILQGGLIILDRFAVFHVNSPNTLILPPMPVKTTLKFATGQNLASVA
jgi:hypothetical protein